MNTMISKIKENTFLSVLVALFLGVFVFVISSYLASFTVPFVEQYVELDFYTRTIFFKLYMVILSLFTIWIVNNKTFTDYGFVKAKNISYPKMTLISIGFIIATIVIGNILFIGIFKQYFPTENTKTFPTDLPILSMILAVWIWSSITEEILSRGLVQGFMNHLKDKKFLGLSISVIFSGLFFGAMHLGLLKAGMANWFVGFTLFNTTIMGTLAAYYREKSKSIIPAIYIHILFNIVGSAPLIIMRLLDIQIPTM